MNSLEIATVAECNRMALVYHLNMQVVLQGVKKKPKYCLLYEGKQLFCNDNLQDMRKFCQDSSNLIALSELQGLNHADLPITIGKFWNVLVAQVIRLKNLPEDIRVDVEGCSDLYCNINKKDIHVSDKKIWVGWNHRHTMTLFDRADYEEADLVAVGLTATDLAHREMASHIKLSRLLSLSDTLGEDL